jgi:transcriptional regulator with XRE-family HTH domain
MPTKAQHLARYKRLPGLLLEMRNKAKLTQRSLAAKLNVTNVAVHKSENGERRVDLAEFCDWAKACGCDPLDAVAEFLGRRR